MIKYENGGFIMGQNDDNKKGGGNILAVIVLVIAIFALMGSCGGGDDYDAGEILDKWTNEGPDALDNFEKDAIEHMLNN